MSTGPGFFKFFFRDTGGEQLEIPPTFARSIKSRLPDTVVLGYGHNRWQVKVVKTGKYRYLLADGWPEFVRDNSIREEDLIIFRYSSRGSFDTKILAPSGCETSRAGGFQEEDARASQENEASNDVEGPHPDIKTSDDFMGPHSENEASDDSEGPHAANEASDDVVGPRAVNEVGDDIVIPHVENENEASDDVGGPRAEIEAGDDIVSPHVEDKNDDIGDPHAENEASEDVDLQVETDDDDDDEDDFEDHIDRANHGKRKSKTKPRAAQKARRIRRVHCDIYGHDIFGTGLTPQPQNPYFVTKINMRRKSEFYIPMELVRDNNLELPEHVTFEDEGGKHWLADRQVWKSGRTYYVKGWRRLCVSNSVQEDDLCICEFIQRGGVHFIKVSIVRAGGGGNK